MERFLASAIPVYIMTVITAAGILGTWITGFYYRQMINQTENMMSVRHSFLLQIKNKFENAYRVNKGINDVRLFVKRQLKENRFLGFSVEKAGRASQKAALLCLIFGGAVALLQKVNGLGTDRIITFLGITLFCFITGICVYYLSDMEYIQEQLSIQLEEYFSNTLIKRMANSREEEKVLSRTENRFEAGRKDRSRGDSSRTEGRKKKESMAGTFFQDAMERRGEDDSGNRNDMSQEDENHFTEEDIQYLRQSLERIAAGRDKNFDNERKHRFSAKEEKMIEDILREYFV